MHERRSAFTILEIMVIIALVGLLTAIVVPHVMSAKGRADQKICINNLRQIDDAIQVWAAEEKAQPDDVVTHTNLIPYLRRLPTCPASSHGTFFTDYGMSFVQDPSYCVANFSLASTPHSRNPVTRTATAAADAPADAAPIENYPKPRKRILGR